MKTLSCWVIALALCCAIGAAEVVTMPETLTLKSGTVLRVKSVVRWTSDGVVVKHAGGADPVRFEGMAPDSRKAWERLRQAQSSQDATTQAVQSAVEKLTAVEVDGQVFSKGFDEPYKFPGAVVTIYPKAAAEKALEPGYRHPEMPNPAAVAKTDADGKFTVTLPAGEYLAMARELRRWRNGASAYFEWRVTFAASGERVVLLLDDSNKTVEQQTTARRY